LSQYLWNATGIPVPQSIRILGFVVLGIAILNYAILANAQAMVRLREIALRKILGASRRQLAVQFLNEMIALRQRQLTKQLEPEELVVQLKLMESYGANCVYITDSAGYMLPDDVTARVAVARAELKPETELGFHGHHNLAMGIANSLAAVEAGANRIDGSLAGLGAGAGNTPLEVFLAVCDRMGVETGVDLFKAMDIAEDLIVPLMDHMVRVDRDSLTLGWAGVYSSFLLFAKRSAARYNLSSRDILVELGRRKTVGGQEDMIEDLALDMAKVRDAG